MFTRIPSHIFPSIKRITTSSSSSSSSIIRLASTNTAAARSEGTMNELYMKALEPKPPAE